MPGLWFASPASLSLWRKPGYTPVRFLERSKVADNTSGNKTMARELKQQLVKAARMYAMCQKAGVSEPMDVTGLAVAAFEDMPLKQALVFVRTNEQNIKDLSWALSNSKSPEEFEQRLKQIKTLPGRDGPGQTSMGKG